MRLELCDLGLGPCVNTFPFVGIALHADCRIVCDHADADCVIEHYTQLNDLASLLQEESDFSRARSLYERALAIREKVFGSEHPQTVQSLKNLALLLRDQGEPAQSGAAQ